MRTWSFSDSEDLDGCEEDDGSRRMASGLENGENSSADEDSSLNEENASSSEDESRDNYEGSEAERKSDAEQESADEQEDEAEQRSSDDRLCGSENGRESQVRHMKGYWKGIESESERESNDEEDSEEEQGDEGEQGSNDDRLQSGLESWFRSIPRMVGIDDEDNESDDNEDYSADKDRNKDEEERAKYSADTRRNGDEEEREDEETSDEEAKSKQLGMNEEDGEDQKNKEGTSEEEEDTVFDLKKMRINPYDVDDHESNNKSSKAFNPVHDLVHKDFMDLLREVQQFKDFKGSKRHWAPERHKPFTKQIDEVGMIS